MGRVVRPREELDLRGSGRHAREADAAVDVVASQEHDVHGVQQADTGARVGAGRFDDVDYFNPAYTVAPISDPGGDEPLVFEPTPPVQPELGRVSIAAIAVVSALFGTAVILLGIVVLMNMLA